MSQKFTQAVEKTLHRAEEVSVIEVSHSLGIGYSTLQKWLVKSKNNELEHTEPVSKEKHQLTWNTAVST